MGTATSWALCLATVCLDPREMVADDRVDLVEVNHFYDERGQLVFDQLIFYDWDASQGHFNVRAWRLIKNPSQLPLRDWRRGRYTAVWYDGDTLRKVQAASLRESWTQHDPELIERSYLPKEQRRELSRRSGQLDPAAASR